MYRTIFVALSLIMATPIAQGGANQPVPAEALVAETVQEMTQGQGEQIADAVISRINVKAIANFTLGRHASRMSEAQKDRFAVAMETYMRRQISQNSSLFSGVRVNVTKTVERNDHDAIVTTRVEGAGEPQTLRWRVIERSGRWSVVDLEFSGVWLAIEQRAQVGAILDRPGSDIEDVIAQFG